MKEDMRKSKEVDIPREETLRAKVVGASTSELHREVGAAEMIVEFSTLPTMIMSASVGLGATTTNVSKTTDVASYLASYDTST